MLYEVSLVTFNGTTERRLRERIDDVEATAVRIRRVGGFLRSRYRLRMNDQLQLGRLLVHQLQLGSGLRAAIAHSSRGSGSTRLRRVLALFLEKLDNGADFQQALRSSSDLLGASAARLLMCAQAAVQLASPESAAGTVRTQAEQEDRFHDARRSAMEAMIYPALLYLGTVLAGASALIFLLPALADSLGVSEAFLRGASQGPRLLLVTMAVAPLLTLVGAPILRKRGATASAIERALGRLPLIGRLRRLRASLSLIAACRITGAGGGTTSDAVRLFGTFDGSALSAELASSLLIRIESGRTLWQAGALNALVEQRVLSELDLCLNSARSSSALERLARSVEQELGSYLNRTKRLVEPIAHGLIAIVVGSMLLSVVQLLLALYEQTV